MATKLKNGMIAIIGNQTLPGPKLLDIEITNTFPIINLKPRAFLINNAHISEDVSEYNHLSIPPDLRLHLTSATHHLFFDANSIWDFIEKNNFGFFHYFTFIGLPFKKASPLVKDGETKTWSKSELVFPSQDKDFNQDTRTFIDFFVHNLSSDIKRKEMPPFIFNNMRPAASEGNVIGPYLFEDLQRKNVKFKDVAFSMRLGYINMNNWTDEAVYLYTPLTVFKKRNI